MSSLCIRDARAPRRSHPRRAAGERGRHGTVASVLRCRVQLLARDLLGMRPQAAQHAALGGRLVGGQQRGERVLERLEHLRRSRALGVERTDDLRRHRVEPTGQRRRIGRRDRVGPRGRAGGWPGAGLRWRVGARRTLPRRCARRAPGEGLRAKHGEHGRRKRMIERWRDAEGFVHGRVLNVVGASRTGGARRALPHLGGADALQGRASVRSPVLSARARRAFGGADPARRPPHAIANRSYRMSSLRPTRYVDTVPAPGAAVPPLSAGLALVVAIFGTLLLTLGATELAEAAAAGAATPAPGAVASALVR